jgi:hypothetical protein
MNFHNRIILILCCIVWLIIGFGLCRSSHGENLIRYDPSAATVPNRVIGYRATGDQSAYLNDPNDITSAFAGYLVDVSLASVEGVVRTYWKVAGSNVVEMTQGEKDLIDAEVTAIQQLSEKNRIDNFENSVSLSNVGDASLPKLDAIVDTIDSLAKWRAYEKNKLRYLLNSK